jgi:hypothetical protein
VVTIITGSSAAEYFSRILTVKPTPVISGIFKSVRIRAGFSFSSHYRAEAGNSNKTGS